jgi:hypothetical protein
MGQSFVITHNFWHLSWLMVTIQVDRLKAEVFGNPTFSLNTLASTMG